MPGWNERRRRRDNRHHDDSNGSWSPYNEEHTHPRDDRPWEDTRMGIGNRWRHERHPRRDDRHEPRRDERHDERRQSFAEPRDERHAREEWRARHEASRAERTNRGNDDGGMRPEDRYAWEEHRRDYREQRDDRGFRGDQRDWRPEQHRATHDRDTERGLHVRDEWRQIPPGEWRSERPWNPDRYRADDRERFARERFADYNDDRYRNDREDDRLPRR